MEILGNNPKRIEQAINYLNQTKESLAEILDQKSKIIKIPIENIEFISDEFNLTEDEIKEILKVIFNLKKQDVIIKYKNSYTIIKYDIDKLNCRFGWFGDENDVENLIKFFNTTYDSQHIFNLVNSQIDFSEMSNKEVEEFLDKTYRKFLFEKYLENIKTKLSEFISDEESLEKISKTIAWKILRDNFEKHLENIALKIFSEIKRTLKSNLHRCLENSISYILETLNLEDSNIISKLSTKLISIRKENILRGLNQYFFLPYYKISIVDDQFLNELLKIIKQDNKLSKKLTLSRKTLKKLLAEKIVSTIIQHQNNKNLIKSYEKLFSVYNWNEIRRWNKKIIFPKLTFSFLDMDISTYQHPWKLIVNQIINLHKDKSEISQKKLNELIEKLSHVIWTPPKITNLNK